jgi:hypothetical protein
VTLELLDSTQHSDVNRPFRKSGKHQSVCYEEQESRYFSTKDAPVSAGLLLDVSKSMISKFNAERRAVSEFFKNTNAHDDYFVVRFRPSEASHWLDSVN